MDDRRIDRRGFVRHSSAAVAAAAVAGGTAGRASESSPDGVLNHNPKMTYRRLGKTGFMISEVALGGHGAAGPDKVANRAAVLDRAVKLGINYVDNNIAGECDLYGKAMAASTAAKRDKWFIGFASWPQKVTEEYESQLTPEKMINSIDDRLRSYRTEMLDMWRPVGATWGKGQKALATMLMVSHKALDMVVEVFEKARDQGKVRFLAISAHNPKVFRRVLDEYPQFSVIIFPYLFLTREFGGDSLLKLAAEKDVGVIGLKPFGAGTVFGLKPQQLDKDHKTDPNAHRLVKRMLREKRLSAVIPGVNVPEQLDENVKGSYVRDEPATEEDEQALRRAQENFYAHLTPGYAWLKHWETV